MWPLWLEWTRTCAGVFDLGKFELLKEEIDTLQGVSFEILLFQMAVAFYWWHFDPKLVEPKCVWEVAVFVLKVDFFK